MSDLKLYRILETFDKLESARDKLTPVKEEDINEEEVDESQTKVQTMGNKVKVTTDGDTTEFDDAETAKEFMGDDDENGFVTEIGPPARKGNVDTPGNRRLVAKILSKYPAEDENDVWNWLVSADDFGEPLTVAEYSEYRAFGVDRHTTGIEEEKVTELDLAKKNRSDKDGVEVIDYSDFELPKEPVSDIEFIDYDDLRPPVRNVEEDGTGKYLHFQNKGEATAYCKSKNIDPDKLEVEGGKLDRYKLAKSELKEGGLGGDAWDAAADEVDMMDIDDIHVLPEIPADDFGLDAASEFGEWEPEMEEGAGYEIDGWSDKDEAEFRDAEASHPDRHADVFGSFGDVHGNYDSHDDGPEFATFDSENESHRKRLQRGTPVVLSPELFKDPDVNRRGVFVNRSPSGHFGTVVRDFDGKEVKVHLSDIKSADIVNNSVYEEYNINFDALLAEDITMTQTTNMENPENDTTTVTAVGPDAADELAAMMANAGLNTGEYAGMDAPPIDAGPVDTGEPEVPAEGLPMQGMIDVMDQPEVEEGYGRNMYAGVADDEYPGDGANLSIDDEMDVEPSNADLDQIEVDDEFDLDLDEAEQEKSKFGIPIHHPMTRDEAMAADGPMNELETVLSNFEADQIITWINDGDDEVDEALYNMTNTQEEMPYGTQKARTGDPSEWMHDHYAEDATAYVEATHGIRLGEERDIEHANTPNELEAGVDMVTHGTSGGLNKPKRMFKPAAGGDNAMQRPMKDMYEDEKKEWKKPWEKDDKEEVEDPKDKEEVEEAEDNTLVNEHENVDSFLDLYKEFTIRSEKK